MGILFFELFRRTVHLCNPDLGQPLQWILMPRPWCAISCWLVIISVFVKKKFLYNFAAITGILNAIIFFAYPGVGFKEQIYFEEFYSISTHCLLLIASTSMITLGHADFRYNRGKEKIWLEYLCFAGVFLYAFIEIIFKVERDPLYFMPGNDVMKVLSIPYPLYLIIYVVFVFGIWTNAFYLIPMLVNKLKVKKEN